MSAAADRAGGQGGLVRAFVALEIEALMRDRIGELQARLGPEVRGVRWVGTDNLHLTLRFLGPSSPAALERIRLPLQEAARACPAARARVAGLGLFPERGSPRVLWLDVQLTAPLLQLQAACERAAVGAGFAPEARLFRSHLTLGRFKERAGRPRLPEADLGETSLERLVLFKSDLRPQGPVYTPLAAFRLESG